MISIIIIVKNDSGVKDTIQSILELRSSYEKEIIVVDSSDKKRLLDIKSQFLTVKWIYYSNLHKKITIPEQRNVGIKRALGDIVVFIDANCIPNKNWLNELVKPIREEGETIVAGATNSHKNMTIHDQIKSRVKSKKYIDECPTINLAFKKDLIEKVGYFDESFNYGSDVDFSWRVIDKGYKVRYQPSAIVSHNWGDTKQELKRAYLYGQARAKLYKKHFLMRWRGLFSKDIIALVYPLFIVGLPITLFLPFYPLLIFIPLIKNRNKMAVSVVINHLIYGVGVLREVIRIKI